MRGIRSRTLWLVTLLLCVSLTGVSAHAAYDNSYLQGRYSFLFNRWTESPTDTELGIVGLFNFDGIGAVTGSWTQMAGGVMTTGSLSGSYLVHANGRGSLTFVADPGGVAVELAFALNTVVSTPVGKVAKSMQVMETFHSGGLTVLTGTAVLQSVQPIAFTNSYLKGSYTSLTNLWVEDATQGASLARSKFDGAGKMTFSSVQVTGDNVETRTGTGTYTVGPDGTVLLTVLYSGGGSDQIALVLNSVAGTLAKGAQYLLLTPTGKNAAGTGNILRQQ